MSEVRISRKRIGVTQHRHIREVFSRISQLCRVMVQALNTNETFGYAPGTRPPPPLAAQLRRPRFLRVAPRLRSASSSSSERRVSDRDPFRHRLRRESSPTTAPAAGAAVASPPQPGPDSASGLAKRLGQV
ncbi:hypothetical protein PR202_ga12936 [Eleusine coracana subsp. coracana]|uniref:Uncharacterized protein n=1 Tax=Eleusine coracana subsp. coracana TaxID=191504 RepID=A0AAV5CDF7_ELECO|nr:hypothetical protein PR202_ga12936 [Eleusine coracana subsp. coracana]